MSKTINLSQSRGFHKMRIIFGIVLFIYACFLIYEIFKLQNSGEPYPTYPDYVSKSYIYRIILLLGWGVLFFILEIGFFFKRFRSYINFEAEYFILKTTSLSKGIVITWKELKNIEFQTNGIKLTTKNDDVHKIAYALINFATVQELKTDFTNYAQQNSIELSNLA